jgi:hypothetical protein
MPKWQATRFFKNGGTEKILPQTFTKQQFTTCQKFLSAFWHSGCFLCPSEAHSVWSVSLETLLNV